jgi:DHA1 family bicyclomycin/chloramphenicol resistance-like MFS transporter
MVLDQAPDRRGMASSLQACIGSVSSGLVAGLMAPWLMHSTVALALGAGVLMGIGLLAWLWVEPRLD